MSNTDASKNSKLFYFSSMFNYKVCTNNTDVWHLSLKCLFSVFSTVALNSYCSLGNLYLKLIVLEEETYRNQQLYIYIYIYILVLSDSILTWRWEVK